MKIRLFVILSIFISSAIFAQEDTITLKPKKNLNLQKNFQYDIIFKPKINDAAKMEIIAINEKMEIKEPTIKYQGNPVLFATPIGEGEKIPAISLKSSRKEKLGRVYVKTGFGNYNNLLFRAHYNSVRNKDYLFTADVKHHSGLSSIEKSNASEQFVKLSGKRIFRDKSLGADLYFSNSAVSFYGFTPDSVEMDTINKEDIKQNFMDFGLNLNFSNDLTKKDDIIKYWLEAGVNHIQDYYKTQELGVNFMGMIEQKFMDNPMRFKFDYQFLNYGQNDKNTRNILNFRASYIFQKELWQSEIGFNIASEGDTVDNYFHFYPILHAEGQIVPKFLSGFAGITGNLNVNSFRSVSQVNPFIQEGFVLKNTNNKFEIYAGLKGSFNEKFGYMAKYTYHNFENLLLFVNDSNENVNRFVAVYDSSNTILSHIQAEISYTPLNNLSFFLNGNFYSYEMAQENYAWHIPDLDITFTTQYELQDKIIADLDVFYVGKRYAKNWINPNNSIELDPIIDLNLGITYKFSNTYAAFFQFNNILGNKYSLWNNYQLRGFHVMGGLKANLFNN